MLAATVATLSSASKRPAPSSASPSGTTLAQGSQSQPPQRSHTCQNSSPRAPVRPDPATGFAPLTKFPTQRNREFRSCEQGNSSPGTGNSQRLPARLTSLLHEQLLDRN